MRLFGLLSQATNWLKSNNQPNHVDVMGFGRHPSRSPGGFHSLTRGETHA